MKVGFIVSSALNGINICRLLFFRQLHVPLLQFTRHGQPYHLRQRWSSSLALKSFSLKSFTLKEVWLCTVGIPLDPIQQRRMAWSGQHEEEEEEEEEEEDEKNISSPLPAAATTTAVSRGQTVEDRPLQMSTADLTTSKTMEEANHSTEEPKRTIGPTLLQQQRKKTNAGAPTSFTSKASLISAWGTGRYLCLLSFIIMFLIDNHPAAWWAALAL